MTFTVVIPARMNSQRLPGKPLLDILGKPMIQHVHDRAIKSAAARVVVATDDKAIVDRVEAFGGVACLTSSQHVSGTDRIQEVTSQLRMAKDHIVVNVQGDEPLLPPAVINQVAAALLESSCGMATLCTRIESAAELFDPNIVKVVMDGLGRALYFSRAPIPWHRDSFPPREPGLNMNEPCYRHLGIYAYRVAMLDDFVKWSPSPLEQIEKLEQLRVLWYGGEILVGEATEPVPPGVDTPEDLERVRIQFSNPAGHRSDART